MAIWGDSVYHPAEKLVLPAFQVVATRYNLALKHFRAKAGISQDADHQRWLDERLKLFTTFCLPSMLNQKRRPHLWLLGMDGESRDAVAPVLDAIKDHP